jgi:hypothetical protein
VRSGSTPWWRHRQRERFARAADSLPRAAEARDPRLGGELAVVVMLRRGANTPPLDASARERIRTKVFDELAQPVTEAPTPSPVPRSRTVPAPARPRRVTGTRGRLVIAVAAAFCVVLALSGMTLLLSRNALPGDPLYGVRRTVESASLGLTVGDDAKGLKHLDYASGRIADIQRLALRHPNLADSPVGDYLTAFADFDSDATAGTVDLTGYASSHGPATLTTLRDWAGAQTTRITQVRPSLPAPVVTRADQSVALLQRIARRVEAVAARNNCYTVTSGATDALGVVPATGPCDRAPGSVGSTPASPAGGIPFASPSQAPAQQGGSGSAAQSMRAGVPVPTTATFPPVTAVPAPVPGVPPGPVTTPSNLVPGTITVPLPLPTLSVPPLLPGVPGVRVGR